MSHSQLDLLSEIAPVRYSRRRKHGTARYWETIDRKFPFDAPGCRVELLLALVKGHGFARRCEERRISSGPPSYTAPTLH